MIGDDLMNSLYLICDRACLTSFHTFISVNKFETDKLTISGANARGGFETFC